MKASDCRCCVCGKLAVAFWPIIDPDIPDHPYCRKCLDKVKAETITKILGLPPKAAKGLTKIFKKNKNKKMNQNFITKVNGVEISTVEKGGTIYVPVKPICEAIGIAFQSQHIKLQDDDFLAPTITIIVTVAADGKGREMVCLPLKYIYGWLASINPGKVAPEAREAVSRYRQECYDVLYEHFTAKLARTVETNNAEIALLKGINEALATEKEAKANRKNLERQLDDLRSSRLDGQLTLF